MELKEDDYWGGIPIKTHIEECIELIIKYGEVKFKFIECENHYLWLYHKLKIIFPNLQFIKVDIQFEYDLNNRKYSVYKYYLSDNVQNKSSENKLDEIDSSDPLGVSEILSNSESEDKSTVKKIDTIDKENDSNKNWFDA